jgi:hypothetical protein
MSDDFIIIGNFFNVNWFVEGPRVLMMFQGLYYFFALLNETFVLFFPRFLV